MSEKKMTVKEMFNEVDSIDFTAVVARLAGEPLTDEQREMCERYDALYDATHMFEEDPT